VFVQLLRTENYSGGRYQVVSGGGDDSIVMENAKTTKVDKSWTISTGQGYKLADKENTKIELAESKVLTGRPPEAEVRRHHDRAHTRRRDHLVEEGQHHGKRNERADPRRGRCQPEERDRSGRRRAERGQAQLLMCERSSAAGLDTGEAMQRVSLARATSTLRKA
jgi:hypothetical protein